jgi:alcohol dehydrogenase class IV
MRFNLPLAAAHYARLAPMFGHHGLGMDEAAACAVVEVEKLIAGLGIAAGLRNHGVPRESLAELSVKAFEDSCHKTNIRPCTRADLQALYEESW